MLSRLLVRVSLQGKIKWYIGNDDMQIIMTLLWLVSNAVFSFSVIIGANRQLISDKENV